MGFSKASCFLLTFAGVCACRPAFGQRPVATNSSLQAQVVYVSDDRGLEPSEIKRAPGPVLLVVKNQTYDPSIELSLSRTDVPGAAAVIPPTEIVGGNQDFLLNLASGTYELVEKNHPNWKLHVVVGE
jgi:hypothetical protein